MLYPELRALFAKSGVLLEKEFAQKLSRTGKVYYLALTGHFVGNTDAKTDIFIVGDLNREKVAAAIRKFEQSLGKEINYTIMAPDEYRYRKDLTDRFLYSILESNKMIIVDKLNEMESVETAEAA